jgi:hypothetical protein
MRDMSTITIVEQGSSDWRIASASGCKVCSWAARELRGYLKRISGVELPVVGEDDGSHSIVVGLRTDLPKSDAAMLPEPAEGYDGFAIAIGDDVIVIAGDNERGVVYGVYELLERIGCRGYYPTQDEQDPEIVPRLDTVQLEIGSMAIASPIRVRINNASSFFFDIDPEVMIRQLDAAMKARYNGMGWQCDHRSYVGDQYKELEAKGVIGEIKDRGMLFHGPAHSFPHFLPTERYFEDHPDWFGMRDGKRVAQVYGGAQFCWSNAEARKVFIDNAEQFIIESPAIDIFCTLAFDGGPACDCPECKKSTPGDLIFQLLNELIERLAVSAPHVRVETSGGYNPVHEPPLVTKAHDTLRIVWAHWGRHHGMGFDDDRYGWKDNLEIWRKAAIGGLTLCMYYTDNFATPWISAPYERVVEGDRRYIIDKRVDGIYMLMYPRGYWWNHSLNNYIAGRCFYDASLAPREVLRDYAAHYFGPDAGPLLLAYYEQWADEIDLPYRVKDDSRECDRAMLDDQRRKWIDPAIAAASSDPAIAHRVGKIAMLHDAAERITEAHRMHDEIEKLRVAGEFDKAGELIETAKTYTDGLIAHMAGLAELDQGLIDRNEVPGFMTMTIKGWIEGEEKAVAARDRTVRQRGEWVEIDSTEMLPTDVTG